VRVQAGVDCGGSGNRAEAVRVERNTIRSTILGKGVYLWVGQTKPGGLATGNAIRYVRIDANRIVTGNGPPTNDTYRQTAGGVVLLGGANRGRAGSIRRIRIGNNRITTAQAGIRLIGGETDARGNEIACVRLALNLIRGTRARVPSCRT
jgi:hypothetical protein